MSVLERVFIFRIILGLSEVDDFRFGDRTGSYRSCSTTLDGKVYIFGGITYMTDYSDQISVVEHCGLTRVGTLPTKFENGACNSFQKSNGESHILLCFGYDEKFHGLSDCHRYFKFHKNNNFKN